MDKVISTLLSRGLAAKAYAACATSFFRVRTLVLFTSILALSDTLILSSPSPASAPHLLSALPDPLFEHLRSTAG
ncbi:hypothetical protein [Pararhizobium sp. PWRC1-1]|uniref:hypothetical protein n=1 Tax=Pararhizobium sp. PWRC1-1 TaxID=2804566 RepID=UPI003CF3ECC8